MFTFQVIDESFSLMFKNELIELSFTPENPDELHKNGYHSDPNNGECSFDFNPENNTIYFYLEKRGCGQGGYLEINLKLTEEIKESYDNALREWKIYLEKMVKDSEDDESEDDEYEDDE